MLVGASFGRLNKRDHVEGDSLQIRTNKCPYESKIGNRTKREKEKRERIGVVALLTQNLGRATIYINCIIFFCHTVKNF